MVLNLPHERSAGLCQRDDIIIRILEDVLPRPVTVVLQNVLVDFIQPPDELPLQDLLEFLLFGRRRRRAVRQATLVTDGAL
ncbi:MAG: hypothetical protein PVI86_16675 [Phycisphaerae bacterium]|jgi:hypothetical protein